MRHALHSVVLLAAIMAPFTMSRPQALAASGVPTLSCFIKESRGMAWVRLEDGKTSHVITAFPGFGQPEVAWARDGKKALVRMRSEEESDVFDFLWEVALPGGQSHKVSFPPLGEPVDVGYDPQGRMIALTAQNEQSKDPLKPVQQGTAAYFMFQGKTYALEPGFEGQPELEHAYRFEHGAWKLIETKIATTGWDYAMRTQALDAYKTLGPRSDGQRAKHPEIESVTDKALAKRLTAIAPKLVSTDGEWGRLPTPGGPVYMWRESGEFIYETNLFVWGRPPQRMAGLNIPNPKDFQFRSDAPSLRLVQPGLQGKYLLVSDRDLGSHPRLYDTAAHTLVWSSNGATDTCFWP